MRSACHVLVEHTAHRTGRLTACLARQASLRQRQDATIAQIAQLANSVPVLLCWVWSMQVHPGHPALFALPANTPMKPARRMFPCARIALHTVTPRLGATHVFRVQLSAKHHEEAVKLLTVHVSKVILGLTATHAQPALQENSSPRTEVQPVADATWAHTRSRANQRVRPARWALCQGSVARPKVCVRTMLSRLKSPAKSKLTFLPFSFCNIAFSSVLRGC